MSDPIKDALLLVPPEHRETVFGAAKALARLVGEEMSETGVYAMMVAGAILQDAANRRRREGGA